MHSPANATNARPVITLIPALSFVLRTRRSEVRILSSAPISSIQSIIYENSRANCIFGYVFAVFLPCIGFLIDCLVYNQVVKFKINGGLEPKVRGSNHLGRAILRMAASDERRTTGLRSNDSSYSELNEQFIAC